MSTKELNVINQAQLSYEFSSIFDGQKYYVQFDYNKRNDTWYLSLRNSDSEVVAAGIACLTNVVSLIGRFVLDDTLIVGEILIGDSIAAKDDPSYVNFGDTVSAFYTSLAT